VRAARPPGTAAGGEEPASTDVAGVSRLKFRLTPRPGWPSSASLSSAWRRGGRCRGGGSGPPARAGRSGRGWRQRWCGRSSSQATPAHVAQLPGGRVAVDRLGQAARVARNAVALAGRPAAVVEGGATRLAGTRPLCGGRVGVDEPLGLCSPAADVGLGGGAAVDVGDRVAAAEFREVGIFALPQIGRLQDHGPFLGRDGHLVDRLAGRNDQAPADDAGRAGGIISKGRAEAGALHRGAPGRLRAPGEAQEEGCRHDPNKTGTTGGVVHPPSGNPRPQKAHIKGSKNGSLAFSASACRPRGVCIDPRASRGERGALVADRGRRMASRRAETTETDGKPDRRATWKRMAGR